MNFLSNIGSAISHGLSNMVHGIWPEQASTSASEATTTETFSHEAEAQTEPEAANIAEEKKTEVPVRTAAGDLRHVSLHHLMNTFRVSTTTHHEDKTRSLYNEIEGIHNNLKTVDQFLQAFSMKLCKHKSVNLNEEPFKKMAPELKKLGIELPTDMTVPIDMEQATILHKSWEHTRSSLEQNMTMKYHKFAEVSKDKEMIQQAYLAMENNHNDAFKKIIQNIR